MDGYDWMERVEQENTPILMLRFKLVFLDAPQVLPFTKLPIQCAGGW